MGFNSGFKGLKIYILPKSSTLTHTATKSIIRSTNWWIAENLHTKQCSFRYRGV